MADYKNIKVKPDVFDRLDASKPDGVSWSYWLDHLAEEADVEATA